MRELCRSFVFTILLLFNIATHADLALDSLSKSEFDKVVRDFSAALKLTSASPASSLGRLFGMEMGLLVGATSIPTIESISDESDEFARSLSTASALFMLSVPFGFTFEAGLLPGTELPLGGGSSLSSTTVGGKWTLTESVLSLPFDLALKVNITKNKLNFDQNINNVSNSITFDNQIKTYTAIASKDFVILEPYIGVGYITSDSKLSSSKSIFEYTSSLSDTTIQTSTMYYIGLQANVVFMRFGIERIRLYESTKYLAKFSFYY